MGVGLVFRGKQTQQVICGSKGWQTRAGRNIGLREKTVGAERQRQTGANTGVRDPDLGRNGSSALHLACDGCEAHACWMNV